MDSSGVNNSKKNKLRNTKLKIKNLSNGLKNKSKLVDLSATIVLGKRFGALRRPDMSSGLCDSDYRVYTTSRGVTMENVPPATRLEGDRLRATELKHIQSSSRIIPVKPWCTGKQLPLGFNLEDWATSRKLDR